jgi:hypothetical protein
MNENGTWVTMIPDAAVLRSSYAAVVREIRG